LKPTASILITFALLSLLAGCGEDLSKKSDAELGLNAQQARGRRVFQSRCAVCHSAYSSSSSKGPAMKGLYRKEYLPSGLVANDRFVEQSIIQGRRMMPAMGDSLDQQQLADLIAYLHTL
jgi:mono/diheme cytochrome c family protein